MCCGKAKTKLQTIQAFVNLYSGPEYMMHFKYAGMLNIIFVTFMYGLAVPLLFPLSFLFFAVSYMVERICLAYSYRLPPSFDDALNKSALSILKFAPLTMSLFGFWVMGNQQIFSNNIYGRTYKTDPVITHHKGYEIKVDQTLPLFIMATILVLYLLASGVFKTIFLYCRIISPDQEIEVDE
jgi:hypothetical protein